jgi:predicted O-linked N-acetylglucosamine transferase (SPINDLY family)
MAQQAHQAGQFPKAERFYKQVLQIQDDHAVTHQYLGLLYAQQDRLDKAAYHMRIAVAQLGHDPVIHANLGEVYRRQGNLEAAVSSFETALQMRPQFVTALFNLGNALKQQEYLSKAVARFKQVLKVQPDHPGARYNLGNTYLEQGKYQSAQECFEAVVQTHPNHAHAQNNLGITLAHWDRLNEAVARYQIALQLDPKFVDAHRNLAQAFEKQGKLDEARSHYGQVLARQPDPLLHLNIETLCPVIASGNNEIDLYRQHVHSVLDPFEGQSLRIDLKQLHSRGGNPPHVWTYQGRDDLDLKKRWAGLFKDGFPQQEPVQHDGKPRIGFVVTNGHEGVFLKCMRGIINHMPNDRFDVYVVCSGQGGIQVLKPAIENESVKWLPISNRLDIALAQITRIGFDVLHYWEIGTDAMNYFLPFCKPARIQCTSWGWPVTSGIPEVDYFLSCKGFETEQSDAHYSERLVRFERLPVYYYRPPVPEWPLPRMHFGLDELQHLYFCTQNLRKVHPDFDPIIAGILRTDPLGQVLFIEDKVSEITQLLQNRFQMVIPDVVHRIRFMPRMPEVEYLNLVSLADVILDTRHYCGGANTNYDAFAAGKPVVTWPTQFHRGRYTFGAYQQMGLMDAVADSETAYIERALMYGTDPSARATFSSQISEARPVLFEDTKAVGELADFFERVLGSR